MLPKIGFAGMTHLGLVSGVAASEKGFHTVCFDPSGARIAALNRKSLPVSEPQLEHLVTKNAERIRFTNDAEALQSCDVVYVASDVPTDDAGQADLASINRLLDIVFGAARDDAVIVVLSQVPPGYTRSKRRQGRMLYYQVETLIFGCAVERALHPERYIVGCADAAQPLPSAYQGFLEADGCPILPMRYESAELAKISINFFLVASVTTSNLLAEVCEAIGADWAEIMPALRLDSRIGPHAYLAPGLGIAGGNLERDLATVLMLADRHGSNVEVVHAWQRDSAYRRHWPRKLLERELFAQNPKALVAIWGLTYKADTHSIKNSPALELLRGLAGRRVRAHDPVAEVDMAGYPSAIRSPGALEALDGADALVVMTPWPVYKQVPVAEIARRMRGRLVVDPYRALDEVACRGVGFDYRRLGC